MPASKIACKRMNMSEVKDKARDLGIIPGKMKKTELIRTIQRVEGNPACFGYSHGKCPNIDCCFMGDCLKIR